MDGPDGRPVRLRLRPARVALLAAGLGAVALALGLAVGVGAGWRGGGAVRLKEENRGLREAVEALTKRLGQMPAPVGDRTADVPGTATGAPGPVPRIRLAVTRSKHPVRVSGEGLVLDSGGARRELGRQSELSARGSEVVVSGTAAGGEGRLLAAEGPVHVDGQPYEAPLGVLASGDEVVVVADLDVEGYVAGVLSAELPRGWEPEALRAQAVAARTYGLWRRAEGTAEPYDVEGTTADQLYRGGEPDPAAAEATRATAGLVLFDRGAPAAAYFHAACGGHTEAAREVWPDRRAPSFPPVLCGRCTRSPLAAWTAEIGVGELADAIGAAGLASGPVTGLRIGATTVTGRVATVEVAVAGRKLVVPGNDLRRMLGFGRVRSTDLRVTPVEGGWQLAGRGAGHGVGLCQWGTRGFAREGFGFRDILGVYYPGLELRRAW